jgi:hypothetical protein
MCPGRRAGPGRLALVAAAAALACAALAGCAGAAAGTGKTPAVCAQAGSITRLVIHRVNGLPQNHERFSFPAWITVSSARRAQSVAQALCALPVMPSGTYACPADWAISYHLIFATTARRFAPVTAEISGCQVVHGLGAVRWTETSPDFWRTLAQAAEITPAGESVFGGTMPGEQSPGRRG